MHRLWAFWAFPAGQPSGPSELPAFYLVIICVTFEILNLLRLISSTFKDFLLLKFLQHKRADRAPLLNAIFNSSILSKLLSTDVYIEYIDYYSIKKHTTHGVLCFYISVYINVNLYLAELHF